RARSLLLRPTRAPTLLPYTTLFRSVHQGYTEPRAAVAQWDSSGTVTVWSNTQLPFEVQNTLAEILQTPPSKIRVVVPGIGGGFGGKLRVGVEHFAAFLARKTGQIGRAHV